MKFCFFCKFFTIALDRNVSKAQKNDIMLFTFTSEKKKIMESVKNNLKKEYGWLWD